MLIDAHAHIFDEFRGQSARGPVRGTGYGRAAIGDGEFQLIPPFNERTCHTAETMVRMMDWADVDRAVLLQGPFYGDQNDVVLRAVDAHPERFRASAYFDPWLPDARTHFERTIAPDRRFCAVKLEISAAYGLCSLHPGARLDEPGLDWLWDALAERGLTLTFDLGGIGSASYQTEAVRRIAERQLSLKIVIAHMGQVNRAAEVDPQLWSAWHEQLALGLLPNVWFDTSALPGAVSEEGYPYPSVERYLRIAVARIGAHKLMWGTDVPALYSVASYRQHVELARRHTAFMSQEEQALVLGGTAERVYRVNRDSNT